jgi:hypothetical protein
MPIKIMLTDYGASPVVICDVCGAWIQDGEEGAYAWSQENIDSGSLHDIAFVHKGRCLQKYVSQHSAVADMSLNVLLPYLVASLGVDWRAASRMAKYFSTP